MAQCGATTLTHFDILKFFGRDPKVASLQKASGREDETNGSPSLLESLRNYQGIQSFRKWIPTQRRSRVVPHEM
jgi:hypothetical protein